MKQNKHISCFVDHLTLKTPRAIHQFMHVKQFATYTKEKIVFLCTFCWSLSFFLNDFIAVILSMTICVFRKNVFIEVLQSDFKQMNYYYFSKA